MGAPSSAQAGESAQIEDQRACGESTQVHGHEAQGQVETERRHLRRARAPAIAQLAP